jgi:hypothetical protein
MIGVGRVFYSIFVDREFCGKLRYLFANPLFGFGVAGLRENVGDPAGD